MATLQPTVLEGSDPESFVQYLLDNHGPFSTLIVCASKDTFITELQAAISKSGEEWDTQQVSDATHPDQDQQGPPPTTRNTQPHIWMTPTLRLLASAQTLKLAFCEDVTHLRAYLAAYPYRSASPDTTHHATGASSPTRILALLDPIALHRDTSAFSAQGLNRTLSIAVDAARAGGSKLVVAECDNPVSRQASEPEAMDSVVEGSGATMEGRSVWDEEISILNVATKTFGAGERGWVGRTVKLKAIASRWFVFER